MQPSEKITEEVVFSHRHELLGYYLRLDTECGACTREPSDPAAHGYYYGRQIKVTFQCERLQFFDSTII